MLKKYFLAFFLFIALGGCKTQYAHFQVGSYVNEPKVKAKTKSNELVAIKAKSAMLNVEKIEVTKEINFVPTFFSKPKVLNRGVKIPVYQESIKHSSIQKDPDPKAKTKRKKQQKRQRFWRQIGGNLVTGFFFLGLAIGLSLLNLPSLAILFGIASILFLIFGLKKIFRKRNRRLRNPFK
jgi:hypothetical protein